MAATTILRMTQRSRNGPWSRQYHVVPSRGIYGREALCGARPNIGTVGPSGLLSGAKGWGIVVGERVTCTRCLAALKEA